MIRRVSRSEYLRQSQAQPEVCATETLERIGAVEKDKPYNLEIHYGAIRDETATPAEWRKNHALFDSGASINCIRSAYAWQHFKPFIQPTKDFYVSTANGAVVITHLIQFKLQRKRRPILLTTFFLIDKIGHDFIVSRQLFRKLGYTIIDPDGQTFTNKAVTEEVNGDLYADFYDKMDYPLKRQYERSVNYVQRQWYNRRRYRPLLFRHKNYQYVAEVNVLGTLRQERTGRVELEPVTTAAVGSTLKPKLGKIADGSIQCEFTLLLHQYADRNAKDGGDIGRIPGAEFKILLKKDAQPFARKPYPLAHQHEDEINRQCTLLEKSGVIEDSKSPYASPVVMVPKPTRNGKKEWRMCIDYRELNAQTIKDKYTVPSIRDIYRNLKGNRVFSSFDLRSGYYHIPIAQADRYKTAFITGSGRLWQWKRMAFGFVNAPATFQRAMDRIFKDLSYVTVYIDDIIICSSDEGEHMRHLREVFARLRRFNLMLRIEKCMFFQEEIKYLGIWITTDGIKPDATYINQILIFKQPENAKEVERYLGMVVWLGRFIPNLSKLTAPLSDLKTKKGYEFKWSQTHTRHFKAIQEAVKHAQILRHPDFDKEFLVQTDASDTAIGAVLLQDSGKGFLEPIEFASRKFMTREKHWHGSEKELIAVVWAIKKWTRYLMPNKFTVFTDHKNLEVLFNRRSRKLGKLQRWLIFLQQFDFVARYLPGPKNYIADYLSRDTPEIVDAKGPKLAQEILSLELGATQLPWAQRHPDYNLKMHELLPVRRQPNGQERSDQLYARTLQDRWNYHARPRRSRSTRFPTLDEAVTDKIYDETKENRAAREQKAENQRPPCLRMKDCGISDNDPMIEAPNLALKEDELWATKINEGRIGRLQKTDDRTKAILRYLKEPDLDYAHAADITTDDRERIKRKELRTNEKGTLFQWTKLYGFLPVVPAEMVPDVIRYFHTANSFHHQGKDRTFRAAQQYFIWPKMEESIKKAQRQ